MLARAAEEPPAVAKPKYKIPELTTYELRDYRHALERAIAFFGERDPAAPALADLRARLDAVIAEQDDRERIARS
jgi:hypothetical protein